MSQTKKDISKYVHRLISHGELEEAERFLRERLYAGERDTVILGSLINVYKAQGGHWEDVEDLSQEYLSLKPNNSFAKNSLALAKKLQNKNGKTKIDANDFSEESESAIRDFRRQIYDGEISIENLSNEQLKGFTEFERTMLLAELYSYSKMPSKAVQLLKKASNLEGITPREKKIIIQAIQLANSTKMGIVQRRMQWRSLSKSKEREL